MKRIFVLMATFTLIFGLTACKEPVDTPEECVSPKVLENGVCKDPDPVITDAPVFSGITDVTITAGDVFDQLQGITATDINDGDVTSDIVVSGTFDATTAGIYTLTYTVTNAAGLVTTVTRTVTVNTIEGCGVFQELVGDECVDIPPTEIVIMHGAVYEIDPFHADYSGTEQLERQTLQREVEERFNVEIKYENYSPSAAWGPSRVTAIIQSSVSGDHLADIYWSVSTWTQELVQNDAIIDVTPYMAEHGQNIDDSYIEIGSYQDGIYGFGAGKLGITDGLYYNADLVSSLGVGNPTQMYLDGDWNWTNFEAWATSVQTALGSQEDHYALGGMLSYYAENMVPLNGGSLINATTGRVSFAQAPALETYNFLTELHNKNLFELSPAYDAGSPEWQTGKVAMYPGSLWFMTADNRWGTLAFEIGFVPYPAADDYTGEYASPISAEAVYSIASGMTPEREELVFQVWNELQLWKTDQEALDDFELILMTKFDDELYIEAYLDVYDKVYLDLINSIGISAYSANGWGSNIHRAIIADDARSVVEAIKPIYEAALLDYLGE